MTEPADFRLQQSGQQRQAVLVGDWTALGMGAAAARLAASLTGANDVSIDLAGVGRLDTAGAYAIIRAAGAGDRPAHVIGRPEMTRLLDLVRRGLKSVGPPGAGRRAFGNPFERIGRAVVGVWDEAYDTLSFLGHLLEAVCRALAHPRKVRWAACVSLAQRASLDALPIVVVTNFFVGALVGLLGANVLKTFGAPNFDVELVGAAVFREFGVLITAVLLAGRSGSSFAAEIGAMKMNQEIDAMRSLGIDPFDALVFPRFFALLFGFPLLTFAAVVAGLAGGMLVCWADLGFWPTYFLWRTQEGVDPTNFWVGLSKAPVMAMVIAAIGCHQGMEVGGDVESLGRRVTSSVVHAIFVAIMVDALFAYLYSALGI